MSVRWASQAQVLGSNDLHFQPSLLTFVTKMITSQAIFVRIVPTAFRRWIMLVKSDKTAFVLVLRSSEKLSFNPFKGRNWEAAAFSLRLFALSSPKWRLHVWLCQLLICRQYLKVAHVSDFHGHHTKGEQIADKGAPFPFSGVVRTTKKYFSDKFYFKAFLTEGWLLHFFFIKSPSF